MPAWNDGATQNFSGEGKEQEQKSSHVSLIWGYLKQRKLSYFKEFHMGEMEDMILTEPFSLHSSSILNQSPCIYLVNSFFFFFSITWYKIFTNFFIINFYKKSDRLSLMKYYLILNIFLFLRFELNTLLKETEFNLIWIHLLYIFSIHTTIP